VLERYGRGLASFIGLPEHPLLLSLHDSEQELRTGYNRNKSVSVWQFGSNQQHVEPAQYIELVRRARPAAFLALCDGDTPRDCSNKRISHSVSKSLAFLDSCLEKASLLPELAGTAVIAAVEGGLELKARRKSAREVAARPVHGFLLDGFHQHGPASEHVVFDTFREALAESVVLLPEEKPRFYFGAAPPHLVFELVGAGVDVFDCTYPNVVTERDAALVFPNSLSAGERQGREAAYERSMEDESFKMDFSPLVTGCTCHTCQHFTRAYVHHLVTTKEMLGRVLLALHNLHHYHTFHTSLQAAVRQDTVEQLRTAVLGQGRHQPAG
jgi:queuine tRNA-ribosyltransferase subunit QTRTD1